MPLATARLIGASVVAVSRGRCRRIGVPWGSQVDSGIAGAQFMRRGGAAVIGLYADTAKQSLENTGVVGRLVVCKAHNGDSEFDMLVHLANPAVLLTVRDPRDSAVSLMQRFNVAFENVAEGLSSECASILSYA